MIKQLFLDFLPSILWKNTCYRVRWVLHIPAVLNDVKLRVDVAFKCLPETPTWPKLDDSCLRCQILSDGITDWHRAEEMPKIAGACPPGQLLFSGMYTPVHSGMSVFMRASHCEYLKKHSRCLMPFTSAHSAPLFILKDTFD